MVWPAIPNGNAANTLALLHQLESSQWLSAEALQQRQFSQLELLLRQGHVLLAGGHHRGHSVNLSATIWMWVIFCQTEDSFTNHTIWIVSIIYIVYACITIIPDTMICL